MEKTRKTGAAAGRGRGSASVRTQGVSGVVPAQVDCPTCGNATAAPGENTAEGNGQGTDAAPESASYVYALGQIEPRLPSLGVEKEFAQATGRGATNGLTDRQALLSVLEDRSNRYLARQLCWVLTIEGLETYLLQPHDPLDLDLLIEAVRERPRPTDVDVVVGLRGPIAPPDACNGLMVPIVLFSQIYSFDVDALIADIPRPDEDVGEETDRFGDTAEELFWRIMQLADNAGATDEHRALNYLALRYPPIYAITSEAHGRNAGLSAVEVRPSRLSGVRKIVDVIFAYTDRQTTVTEQYFARVDVTEMFPFLVSPIAPFYER
jgi:hypothetical protein